MNYHSKMASYRRLIALILLLAIGITACDCVQHRSGLLLDRKTRAPVAGVAVFRQGPSQTPFYSGPDGRFEWSGISGGLFRCPAPRLVFVHPDYDTLYSSERDDILLLEKKVR